MKPPPPFFLTKTKKKSTQSNCKIIIFEFICKLEKTIFLVKQKQNIYQKLKKKNNNIFF